MRWVFPAVIAVVLVLGCTCTPPKSDPLCYSLNPCVKSTYNQTLGECVEENVKGTAKGCSTQFECLRYYCVEGECIANMKGGCCGNNICDAEEGLGCVDCGATCKDGMLNQGEERIDCGGPCESCSDMSFEDVRLVKILDNMWYNISLDYAESIMQYNKDYNTTRHGLNSAKTRVRVTGLKSKLNSFSLRPGLRAAVAEIDGAADDYVLAMDNMVFYSETKNPEYLSTSNYYLNQSRDKKARFNEEYTRIYDEYNKCFNAALDAGEERIDCGTKCGKPCSVEYKITKHLTIYKRGVKTDVLLNVTAPAMPRPPLQEVIGKWITPSTYKEKVTREGTVYYEITAKMGEQDTKFEADITYLIRVNGGYADYKMAGNTWKEDLAKDEYTTLTDRECRQASSFQAPTIRQTLSNISAWMSDNIEYAYDDKQYPSVNVFDSGKGACDEHSNLMNSFARCLKIPSREVIGYMLNETTLTAHSWNEYYDNGWVYADMVYKDKYWGVTNTIHIIRCMQGDNNLCNNWYSYTYYGNRKPEITIKEQTFLANNKTIQGIEYETKLN